MILRIVLAFMIALAGSACAIEQAYTPAKREHAKAVAVEYLSRHRALPPSKGSKIEVSEGVAVAQFEPAQPIYFVYVKVLRRGKFEPLYKLVINPRSWTVSSFTDERTF